MQVGNLELNLLLNRNQFDATLREAERDAKMFGRTQLEPRVNHQPLTELNQHYDIKQAHHDRLNRWFNANPLTPQVDLSQLERVHDLMNMAGLNNAEVRVQVHHSVKNNQSSSQNYDYRKQELLAKQTATVLKEGIKEGFKEANKGSILGAVTAPIKQIVSGSFFRLGQNVADRGVSKFAATERGQGIFQELDLATENVAEALSRRFDNLASVLGGYDGKQDAARDLIGDVGEIIESIVDPEQFETLYRETTNGLARSLVRIESGTSDLGTEIVEGLSLIQARFKTQINNLAYRGIQLGALPVRFNAQIQAARSANQIQDVIERDTTNGKVRRFKSVTDNPELEDKQILTLVAPGFQKEQGKAGLETVKMLEPFFDLEQTALIPVRNTYTDRKANDAESELNDAIISMFGSNPLGQEGLSMVMNVEKLLGTSLQGVNPDSVRLAALAVVLEEKFPDKTIQLAGFSGGGFIVEEAIAILEMLGKTNIKGLGFGSPLMGLSNRASANFQAVVGNTDPLTFPYLESVLGDLPETIKKALVEKLGIPEKAVGQGIVNPPNNVNILDDFVGGHDMQGYLQSEQSQRLMRSHLQGTKSVFQVSELPESLQNEPALQAVFSMLSESNILDSGMGARHLANIGQIQRKLIKPQEKFEDAISNPESINLDKLGNLLGETSENLVKFERVIKALEGTFRAKNFDNLPEGLDKKYIDQVLRLVLNEIPYVKDAKQNISRVDELKTQASKLFLEKSGYDSELLEQIDPSLYFDIASYVGKRSHDDANVLRGIELYQNPDAQPTTKGEFEFYNPSDADKRVNFDFRDYIALALEGLVKQLPASLQAEGNEFVQKMKNLQQAWSKYIKDGVEVPQQIIDQATQALSSSTKLDLSQAVGDRKKLKRNKQVPSIESIREKYAAIESKVNKNKVQQQPIPIELNPRIDNLVPLHQTTNDKLDTIISLMMGDEDGGSNRPTVDLPDSPPGEIVPIVSGERTSNQELARNLATESVTTATSIIQTFTRGATNAVDEIYRLAREVEQKVLPGEAGERAKKIAQNTVLPAAVTLGLGNSPVGHLLVDMMHQAVNAGASDVAQGIANGIMEYLTATLPDGFHQTMQQATELPIVGDLFAQARGVPRELVQDLTHNVTERTARVAADVLAGKGALEVGRQGYEAIANAANPERQSQQDAQLLDRVNENIARNLPQVPGEILDPNSAVIDAELENMKVSQQFEALEQSAAAAADKLTNLFSTAGLRRLAPMLGIPTTADTGQRPIKSAKKQDIADTIARMTGDADLERGIANASPQMFLKKYQDLGKVKPEVEPEIFDNLKRYWQDAVSEINATPLDLLDSESAIAQLEGFATGYVNLLNDKELTGNQRASAGSLHGQADELKQALQAFSQFKNIEDLSQKFQQGASKAGKHWGNTTQEILQQFAILAREAKGKGYDIQRFISEGSPGPTEKIRKHWLRTTKYLLQQIGDIQSSAKNSGSKIQKAFEDDPSFGAGLDRVQEKLLILQNLLANELDANISISFGGNELEGRVTQFLADKLAAIESIESGARPEISTTSNDNVLPRLENDINRSEAERLQRAKQLQQIHRATASHRHKEAQKLVAEEERMKRVAQVQAIHRATANHYAHNEQVPTTEHLSEQLSWLEKLRQKAQEIHQYLFNGEQSEIVANDPLQILDNAYQIYSNTIDNAPNSSDIFDGIKKFTDEMSARSPVFKNILDFGKDVGISTLGLLSFNYLAESIKRIGAETLLAGRDLQRFKIQMEGIGNNGEFISEDIFERSQGIGSLYLPSRTGYQRFSQATQGLGNDEIVDPIFEGFQKAFVAKQTTAEQQTRGYTAIEQIFSKGGLDGSVQSEELKGQLSEALSGSYGVAAKVRGQSPKELAEDMKAAQVEAADLLIRMAAFYEVDSEILLRINSSSFDAELNRLQNNLAKIQEETGENLLPVGKLGLQAANTGLDLLSENFAVVSTVSGGVFLMFITKMALAMYEVVKQTKLGTLAIKAFGIEAFQTQVRSQGLVKTTGNLAASGIGSTFKALALPTAGAVALDLGYKTLTEGRGKRSTREALDVIENLDISEEERTERRSGFLNSVYNPYALIKMAGRKRTQEDIFLGIEEAENVLAGIQENINSVEFASLKSEFDDINTQIQLLQAQRINLVENDEIEQVGKLDKQLGELNRQKKNVLQDLTLGLVKTSNIEKALSVFENDLEDLKLQFGEDFYNRVKQQLGSLGDEAKNQENQINEAIEALSSNAVVAIRMVTRSIADSKFTLDLQLNQDTIDNIDRRLAGLLSSRTLEIANTQAQLVNQQGLNANLQQNRRQLEADIREEPNIAAIRTSFKVSDNDELFDKLAQTSPDTVRDKIENSKTAPDLAKSLELAQEYVTILQQEKQSLVNVKSTQLDLVNKNREYAKSLYEFGSSIRDFSRSLEDMDIERRRFEEDFPLQISNAARNINRNGRNLQEQYEDFILELERNLIQTQSEIADLEKQIANTQADTSLLKQFTPGSNGFGREITELFNEYSKVLSSDTQKSTDIELSRLELEAQTLQHSRQIRNLAEQRVDFELERLEQIKTLNRQQEDFNRQQHRSWEDALDQFHNIGLQASEMGVSLDLTAEQVAQQGNGLITVLNELAQKLQVAGDNLLNQQRTSNRDAFPIKGLTPDTADISSGFGWRTIWGQPDFHEGIDFAVPGGTEVVATNSGTVKKIVPLSDQMQVGIETAEGVMEWFIHLSKNLKVKKGDYVLSGQPIGEVAHTSAQARADRVSTGDHLDYRVTVDNQWTNPKTFLESVRAGTHSRFNQDISPITTQNFKNVDLAQTQKISTNYGNTIDISSKVLQVEKIENAAHDAANEMERLQSLLEVKSQLQIEQQEANEENALFNLIENLAQKKLEIEDYYRNLAQTITDREASIARTVANAKGYLIPTEQIDFAGDDVRQEYQSQIREIEQQQRELERKLQGDRDALKPGGKLDLLVQSGNEDAIAAQEIIEQQIVEQVKALARLDEIKVELEANVDFAVDTAIDNKALELDFQKRADELGISSELLDLRKNLAPSFIHDLSFNDDYRSLGETEIQLDYDRQLKELEKYRGEVDELENVYDRLKGSLDELNQAKLDSLYKETSSLVQIFDEVAQPALNGLLDDFIDGATSAGEAWSNFTQSILLSLSDILMAYAKNELLRVLFGNEVDSPGVDISGKTEQKGGLDFSQILNAGIGAASNNLTQPTSQPQAQGGGFLTGLLGIGSQIAMSYFREGGDTTAMYIPHASLGLDANDIALARGIKQAMIAESHPAAFPAVLHKGETVLSDLTGDAQLHQSLKQSGEWQRIKAEGVQRQPVPNFRFGSNVSGKSIMSQKNSETVINNYSSIEVHAKDVKGFNETEDNILYRMQLKQKQSKR